MLLKLQEKVQCVRGERKLNFGNEITEILVLPALPEMEINNGNGIAENGRKKKIVATKLSKMEGKKEKRRYVHNIFHNKLQVVSYYWFKFESNTKLTFLPQ